MPARRRTTCSGGPASMLCMHVQARSRHVNTEAHSTVKLHFHQLLSNIFAASVALRRTFSSPCAIKRDAAILVLYLQRDCDSGFLDRFPFRFSFQQKDPSRYPRPDRSVRTSCRGCRKAPGEEQDMAPLLLAWGI